MRPSPVGLRPCYRRDSRGDDLTDGGILDILKKTPVPAGEEMPSRALQPFWPGTCLYHVALKATYNARAVLSSRRTRQRVCATSPTAGMSEVADAAGQLQPSSPFASLRIPPCV